MGNQLSGALPRELGNLVNLVRLRLNKNRLEGEIPGELGNLVLLEDLFLSGNQLTGEIPSELCALKKLKHLSLYDNQLTGTIPEGLGDLNLLGLWLDSNRLYGPIPESLTALTCRIELQDNLLSGIIPLGFSSKIDLRNNYFTPCETQYPPNYDLENSFQRPKNLGKSARNS
mmetsp:Transcript_22006/g.28102  ORF Transcript_22006/g.28102 Transcript_22006/m.28102 type:complete len:172 (-) Transcript_22006:49-564(-)